MGRLWVIPSLLSVGLLMFSGQSIAQSSGPSVDSTSGKVNVYCTNNRDGTGSCFETSNNTPYDCVAVQGTVVPCKSPAGLTYECQWVGHSDLVCSETASAADQPITTDLFTGLDPNFPQLQDPPPAMEAEPALNASEFAETFQPAGSQPQLNQGQASDQPQSQQVDSTVVPGSTFLEEFQAAPQ